MAFGRLMKETMSSDPEKTDDPEGEIIDSRDEPRTRILKRLRAVGVSEQHIPDFERDLEELSPNEKSEHYAGGAQDRRLAQDAASVEARFRKDFPAASKLLRPNAPR